MRKNSSSCLFVSKNQTQKKYFFCEKPIDLESDRGCSGALLFEASNSRGCLAVASAGSALLSHFCPTETFCKQRRKSKRRIFSWILKILNKSIDQKCFTELFGCISRIKISRNVSKSYKMSLDVFLFLKISPNVPKCLRKSPDVFISPIVPKYSEMSSYVVFSFDCQKHLKADLFEVFWVIFQKQDWSWRHHPEGSTQLVYPDCAQKPHPPKPTQKGDDGIDACARSFLIPEPWRLSLRFYVLSIRFGEDIPDRLLLIFWIKFPWFCIFKEIF